MLRLGYNVLHFTYIYAFHIFIIYVIQLVACLTQPERAILHKHKSKNLQGGKQFTLDLFVSL